MEWEGRPKAAGLPFVVMRSVLVRTVDTLETIQSCTSNECVVWGVNYIPMRIFF